jgi:TonB family protein
MRSRLIIGVALIIFSRIIAWAGDRRPPSPLPSQFQVGRHTFFDFGPPNDFYEVFVVRSTELGTSIEKITLTPAADACVQPATVETASASISESTAALLGATNPCLIPEKELRHELTRCKDCLVFSGVNVAMQFQCGDRTRIIRSDILDKDMFDSTADTPKQTSWTMRLLGRLDRAVGPGVMEKPMFEIPGEGKLQVPVSQSKAMADVSSGKYDALFPGTPDKPSDLYREAQHRPPDPTIRLSSVSVQPETFVSPDYPPLARLAHVEGTVAIKFTVDPGGSVTNLSFEGGPPLLRGAVEKAAKGWRFPISAVNQRLQATVDFALNCPAQHR